MARDDDDDDDHNNKCYLYTFSGKTGPDNEDCPV